jgi:hypothetical protein
MLARPWVIIHGRVVHFIGWLVGGAGEVRRASLATVVEEDAHVDIRINADTEDIGLDGGAEANSGVKVHKSIKERAALVITNRKVKLHQVQHIGAHVQLQRVNWA